MRLRRRGQPVGRRGRDRHVPEHARPEDRRRHRRRDDVRHGGAVGRLARGRSRSTRQPYLARRRFPADSTAAAGGLAQLGHGRPSRHRHLRRRADGRARRSPRSRSTIARSCFSPTARPTTTRPRSPRRSPRPSRPMSTIYSVGIEGSASGHDGASAARRPRPAASSCRRPIARPWSRPTPRSRPTSRARSRSPTTASCRRARRSTWRSARPARIGPGVRRWRRARRGAVRAGQPLLHMPTSAAGRAGVAVGCRGARCSSGCSSCSRPGPAVAVGKRIAAYTEPKKRALEIPGASPVKSACSPSCSRPPRRSPARSTTGSGWRFRLEQADLPLRTGRGLLHPDGRRPDPGRVRALRARPERPPRAGAAGGGHPAARRCSSSSWRASA